MKVILLEKVKNLGGIGEQVKVKAGYARNFLLPLEKAVPANDANIKMFETRRAELEKLEQEKLVAAKALEEKIKTISLRLTVRAGDEGKLFGSIGPREIAVAFKDQGVEISKSEIDLVEGPIRMTGEHHIMVHLHSEVVCEMVVNVAAEDAA